MLLKVNYFATDKGNSLNCRIFIEAKMSLLCVYAEFHLIYFHFIFFYSVQFFESFSIRYKLDFVQQDKKAKEMSFKAV